MAASVATPLEKQFSTIAGVTSISSSNGQGSTNITLQFDLSRDIDSAAQDVQSMIARAAPIAAARHAVAAVVPEGEPGRLAGAVPDAELVDAAAVAGRPVRGNGPRAAAVDGQRRRAGQRVRRAEVRRARRRRPDAARVAADRHRPGRAGDRRRERQPADRHAVRPEAQLRRADERPADGRRGVPADRGRLPQRQPGAAERGRERLRRRREPAQRQLVQRHADDLPRDLSASRAPTPSRSSTRIKALLPQLQAQLPGCARSSASAATARCRSASRSTTSSSRWS